ncbi:hypothetical protein J4457_04905, partial [Candidatus Woesearchaeota archaeon]|nr:hypothetical protein [Candidatus Woesearchaeota archaeon]
MYIPKKYGYSKKDYCPFCQKEAMTYNNQKVPVCSAHKTSTLQNMKCVCGKILDLKNGKFGPFFSCLSCGNMSLKKILEVNTVQENQGSTVQNQSFQNKNSFSKSNDTTNKERKEITIRSDDPRY